MEQDATHVGPALSYAAVADPRVPTDVHHDDHPHEKHHSPHKQHESRVPEDPTQAPSYAQVADPGMPTAVEWDEEQERPDEPAPSNEQVADAAPTHADDSIKEDEEYVPSNSQDEEPVAPTNVDDDGEEEEDEQELLEASAADEPVQQYPPPGLGLEVVDGDAMSGGAVDGHEPEELEDLSPPPIKEPGEPVQPVSDHPVEDGPAILDPFKSTNELNEVEVSKWDHGKPPARERTALQKHCDFFDPDGDGVIWPWDTFFGFWVLGYALIWCIIAVFAIHGPFSWPTQPHFPIPDPFFRIYLDRISMSKHGSDTGGYDHDGNLDLEPFERIFQRNAKTRPDALTGHELFALIRNNRVLYDPFGWLAGALEWLAVYLLFWPEDNLYRKEDVKGIYDGRIFYEIAHQQKMRGRYTPPGWKATVEAVKKQA